MLNYMAQNLFILDPVFGVLRSFDTLQPYRLEMGCKGVVASNDAKGKKETLASYWKESVTSYLGRELIKSTTSRAMWDNFKGLANDGLWGCFIIC